MNLNINKYKQFTADADKAFSKLKEITRFKMGHVYPLYPVSESKKAQQQI